MNTLLLVNTTHPLPPHLKLELLELTEEARDEMHFVSHALCATPLRQMLASCRKAGYAPYLTSAYRSQQAQQRILDRTIATYQQFGLNLAAATKAALGKVAQPGTSEHETGLAFDIVDKIDLTGPTDETTITPAQAWLLNHCWEYGFIVRYPQGKETITGYKYEPWHYRYVGTANAIAMHTSGFCLEEYCALAQERPLELNIFNKWGGSKVIAGYAVTKEGLYRYQNEEDRENYAALAHRFGLTPKHMVRVHQYHTDRILPVSEKHGGYGILYAGTDEGNDGLITQCTSLMLCIVTADCVPVYLYDPAQNAIGLIHSGRSGTAQEIVCKAVERFKDIYHSRPEDIHALLGPYLCAKHHGVGLDEYSAFDAHFTATEQQQFITIREEKAYIDMGNAICLSLVRAGVMREHITDCGICTYERPNLHSRRRDKNPLAHNLSFIFLTGDA